MLISTTSRPSLGFTSDRTETIEKNNMSYQSDVYSQHSLDRSLSQKRLRRLVNHRFSNLGCPKTPQCAYPCFTIDQKQRLPPHPKLHIHHKNPHANQTKPCTFAYTTPLRPRHLYQPDPIYSPLLGIGSTRNAPYEYIQESFSQAGSNESTQNNS